MRSGCIVIRALGGGGGGAGVVSGGKLGERERK